MSRASFWIILFRGLLGSIMAASTTSPGEHWAYQDLAAKPIPPLRNQHGIRNPVDAFIQARLESKRIAPTPDADRRTLLRRVYFDLIGLPPSRQELDSFVRDPTPDAYERRVDSLLRDPRHGERWARHWMDAAHFAETHGHDQDRIRTHAWPYRDYLIQSFNRDTPYPQFIREQVAGDILYPDRPESTIALGFLAAGPWDESSLRDIREDTLDRQIARYIDRDDIVTTVMSVVTSTTVHCARCHDHKFDPVSQREYYGLQAVFAGVDRANRFFDRDPGIHRRRQELMRERREIHRREPQRFNDSAVQKELAEWELSLASSPAGLPTNVVQILKIPSRNRTPDQTWELIRHVTDVRIQKLLAELPPPERVYAAASDFEPDGSLKPVLQPRDIHMLKRGDITQPQESVRPGALRCVSQLNPEFASDNREEEGARRAALAHWLTARDNPLTWRSIVNRIWGLHFGRGLVDTPNDFGRLGSSPSHPELLDWLAVWFRDEARGSLKDLHRLLVTSATYRQSSASRPISDNDNRLLWRMNRTRLDAESIRDTVLYFSGSLDRRMGGPGDRHFDLHPGIHVTPKVDYTRFKLENEPGARRSIYRFLFRTLPDPFMDALDCPAGDQMVANRLNSVTVQQALAMWNHALITHHAEVSARKLKSEIPDSEQQIDHACEIVWGRPPDAREKSLLLRYASNHGMANLIRLMFNSNEFAFVD